MFLGQAGPDFAKAHHALKGILDSLNQQLPEDEQQFIGSKDFNYLRTWWGHWIENGSVDDAHRSGRSRKCNEKEALEAAQICKEGKLVEEKVKGNTVQHRVHFTSLGEAIRESPRLKEIMNNNGLKFSDQLLHAMHDADPSLVRRKLFFKHSFTTQELQERVDYAKHCLGIQEGWPAGCICNTQSWQTYELQLRIACVLRNSMHFETLNSCHAVHTCQPGMHIQACCPF
jgi:hypothetical protein